MAEVRKTIPIHVVSSTSNESPTILNEGSLPRRLGFLVPTTNSRQKDDYGVQELFTVSALLPRTIALHSRLSASPLAASQPKP